MDSKEVILKFKWEEFVNLWPYDELEIDFDQSGQQLQITLPWFKMNALLEEKKSQELIEIKKRLEAGDVRAEDVAMFSHFLEGFIKYPIYYILPYEKSGDIHKIKDNSIQEQSFKKVFESMSFYKGLGLEFVSLENIQTLEAYVGDDEFTWDIEAALQFANAGSGVTPESLLTVARRFYMSDVVNNTGVGSIYREIRTLDKKKATLAAALMVRQNHYVTNRCLSAVAPALVEAQSSKTVVEEFMNEEKGHEIILQKALEAMDHDISLEASLCTMVAMDLLQFCANRNFLAFAILIDFFERSNYSDTDPLADLLEDLGFRKSASFINKHMHINDVGEHELVSFELLKPMGLVSDEYAREALILAELASFMMNQVVQSTYRDFSQKS